ncbi:altronate hydrolase [Vibrio galatheae]|uniref:Altronate hydrolase n=1 Tax=Vibrio galatheae TaxID=579748 RepID=A0A0F4NGE9_9VIBR|nr:altronate dehydratase family protein [Vibrio galatheae]KJY81918.1 altronate hydrolase [Vibrio galatheae]
MKPWIRIHEQDNVIIALQPLKQGECVLIDAGHEVTLLQDVDKGHKVAIDNVSQGEHLIKYGEPFGHASEDIISGQWVHSHNAKTNLSDKNDYIYRPVAVDDQQSANQIPVNIYRRHNGGVGIRNELWVIPTVGCVNGMAQRMVNQFLADSETSDIDGVYVFPHQFGCSQLGDDHETTKRLLQSMAQHPNAGGVLIVGLGCENNQVDPFMSGLTDIDPQRVRCLVSQKVEDEVEHGVELLTELHQVMRHDKREAGHLSELKLGLECGGSDGLSGITANPLLGQLSDYLIAQGGTTVLTEVPEMFGAETLLMNRASNESVFNQIVEMVNGFKDYYLQHDLPVYENPSPGNKAGGITTLEDKSLGCTQKAGRSAVVDVVGYTQRLKTPGLNLLNAPGNDAIATSALAASGCQMVLFTTGRGTPYGGFVPTLKLSTNTELAIRKPHWIDFDAGRLVSSDVSMPELLDDLITTLVAVVNGEPAKNEHNQIRELAIWKNGVTL